MTGANDDPAIPAPASGSAEEGPSEACELPAEPAPEPGVPHLSFLVEGDGYAVPLDLVHSIQRPVPVTPVPFTPATVLGVVALRGQVVPVLDLQRCLGRGGLGEDERRDLEAPTLAAGPSPRRILVLEAGGGLRSLLVEPQQEILHLGDEHATPDLDSPLSPRLPLIRRMARVQGRIYSVLDPRRLGDYFEG